MRYRECQIQVARDWVGGRSGELLFTVNGYRGLIWKDKGIPKEEVVVVVRLVPVSNHHSIIREGEREGRGAGEGQGKEE